MCGICGYISHSGIPEERLREMNDSIAHRGPDDSGIETYVYKDWTIGFAQRRLAIQDISPLGHQPMHTVDGRISVVFNGEIYNFLELKRELSGYPFRSACDTEVLLAAYMKWGKAFLTHLNGMFALALLDRQTGELLLARDRVGKKPLFYWQEGERLVFASELKPIMLYPGFCGHIRRELLARYLYHGYILGPDTIFENIYKLRPGGWLLFKDGQINEGLYWDVNKVYHQQKARPPHSYAEAKIELKERLQRAVDQRMIADVPLGTFLSGGYDSSLITALAQNHSVAPVKTYSIGFREKEYNEACYAERIAAHLGTRHTTYYAEEHAMLDMVRSIPQYYDEPFADSSQIPTMMVSKLARQEVTVVLSGDGGDELFCGYNVYDKVRLAEKLDGLGGLLFAVCGKGKAGQNVLAHLPGKVKLIVENREPQTKTQFSAPIYRKLCTEIAGAGVDIRYAFEQSLDEKNWQERRMLLDVQTYLADDILAKVDRASMKYALETRCPILDTNVVQYAFSLHHSYKYKSGIKKRILKDIAYDFIPKSLLDRQKTGFSAPIDKWLRGPLKEDLLNHLKPDYLKLQGLFQPEATTKAMRGYLAMGDASSDSGGGNVRLIWALYMFQLWYDRFKPYIGKENN